MRLVHRILLAMLPLLPAAARAQDPETAATLQSQLRGWLATWPGTTPIRPEPPVRVQAEDDHYQIEWPLATNPDHPPSEFTASLRLLDGGRWEIATPRLTPGTLDMTVPAPPGTNDAGPTHLSIRLAGQSGRAEIDPTFASPSTLALQVDGLTTVSDNAISHQTQHFDQYTMRGRLVPDPDGRVDVEADGSAERWSLTGRTNGLDIDFKADKMRGGYRIRGVSRAAATALAGAFTAMVPMLPNGSQPDQPLEPAQAAALRNGLRDIVQALRGSLTSLHSDAALDDIRVNVATSGPISIAHMQVTISGEAPDDILHAWWNLALDGIAAPNLPPDIADFVPTQISLRPSVSGIDMTQLTRLAVDATAEPSDWPRMMADTNALWSNPAAQFGIEALQLVIGPARIDGSGQVHFIAPGQPVLTARVSASGIDALLAQASGKPAVQQAVPLLLMLRGMGHQDGNRLIWDLVVSKEQVLVNGIDMKQLGGRPKH